MKHLIGSVAVVALLAAPAARADDSQIEHLLPIGMSAMVGGGISQFIDSNANSHAPLGGNWTARFTIGTRSYVGAEIAYLGSSQAINALGLDDRAFLLSNGLEGAVRLNAFTGSLQPYATAGLGWRYFSVQNTRVNTSSIANADSILEVPLAVGLAYRYAGFVVDARADLRPTFYQELMGATSLTNWSVGAKVGWEF